MNPLNDYLVQIIGLPDSYRSNVLESQLRKLEIPYISKLGVIISEEDFVNQKFHNDFISRQLIKRPLTRGELGCAIAHENCYIRLLESNYKFSLIFEDDAFLINGINFDLMSNILNSSIPTIILLGYDEDFSVLKSKVDMTKDVGFEILIPSVRAHAYAVNRSAAQHLIIHDKDLRTLADWPVKSFRNIRFISLIPRVAIIDELKTESEIDKISSRPNLIYFDLRRSVGISLKSTIKLFTLKFFNGLDFTLTDIIYMTIVRDLLYKIAKKSQESELYRVIPRRYHLLKLLVLRFYSVR